MFKKSPEDLTVLVHMETENMYCENVEAGDKLGVFKNDVVSCWTLLCCMVGCLYVCLHYSADYSYLSHFFIVCI